MTGTSLRGDTAWLMRFIPIIMMANPSRTDPTERFLSDLPNIFIATPMIARNGENVLGFMRVMISDSPSIAFSDNTHAVAVVPRLAPMISPAALLISMSPELTRPTDRTVIADEDCTTAVTTAPNTNAKKRFFVILPITFLSVPPVKDVSDSLSVSIPVRNSARPQSMVATINNISTDDIWFPFDKQTKRADSGSRSRRCGIYSEKTFFPSK